MPKLLILIILASGISLSGCGGGGSSPAAVNPPPSNQAPTADAGADQSVDEGTTVNLSGTGADGDGTIVSYSWQQESGTAVTITNANTANASFVAPTVAASEVLLFRVTVTDDDGATGSDTVTVTVNDITPRGPIDNSVAYSTFIGMGVSGAQGGANSVVVDDSGNVYVAGFAFTTDFGATPGAFQTTYGGGFSDGFVAKFNSDGALIYLTFLGGSGEDDVTDIAVDDVGNAYVVGITRSGNFPTVAAFQTDLMGGLSVFVAKLDASGSTLIYSTYLGGNGQDLDAVVAVDSAGSAYVAGGTTSIDFPITPGSFQQNHRGNRDVFVSKLGSDGSLIYSTYVGGSEFDGQDNDIAVDNSGHAYVITELASTDFPTTPGAYQPAYGGGFSDAAVFKVAPAGDTLIYSTYLGGSEYEQSIGPFGIAVDGNGSAYVVGSTGSFDFPVTPGAYQMTMEDPPTSSTNQASDLFVTKLNPAGDDLVFSTYIGGTGWDTGHDIAIDGDGNSYITGHTFSSDFPVVNPLQNVSGAGEDVIAAKLDASGSALVFSNLLGGEHGDFGESLAIDLQRSMLIVGSTFSSDYPVTNAIQDDCGNPCQNGMITKIINIPDVP